MDPTLHPMPDPDFVLTSRRVMVGREVRPASLIIRNGMIDEILVDPSATYELPEEDVGDLLVIPGLVDTHVHINEPGRSDWEGFETATQAAAAGGITSIVDMPLNCTPVTTSAEALARKMESLAGKLWIDCGFWGGVIPSSLGDLKNLLEAGVLGVKSFTIDSGIDDFPLVEESHIRQAIPIIAEYHLPYLIHAELQGPQRPSTTSGTSYQKFLESRPGRWENDAIAMLIRLGQEAMHNGIQARLHVVHLSSAEALSTIAQAKEKGLFLTVETCPHYLSLCAEDIPDHNPLFKCCPPIREKENRERLWQGLFDGIVDFIVSDHSPCSPELRRLETGEIDQAWGGISSLQFGLPIIWGEANSRGVNLTRVVDWMSTRPAQFAGLGNRKGRLAQGYDADMVVFDDEATFRIQPETIKYRHKVTPYAGHLARGTVTATYVRGQKVYADGKFSATPRGTMLLRQS